MIGLHICYSFVETFLLLIKNKSTEDEQDVFINNNNTPAFTSNSILHYVKKLFK